MQHEYHVEFLNVKFYGKKKTARLQKVNEMGWKWKEAIMA